MLPHIIGYNLNKKILKFFGDVKVGDFGPKILNYKKTPAKNWCKVDEWADRWTDRWMGVDKSTYFGV